MSKKLVVGVAKAIEAQELALYKEQVASAKEYSVNLDVKSESDYALATDYAVRLKGQLDTIEARKEEITKPMNAALNSVRDLFRPLEMAGYDALQGIKKRMLRYTKDRDDRAEAEKARLDTKVEKGTLKEGTAEVKKFMIDQTLIKTVSTDEGRATTRKVKKYEVLDIMDVPKEFLLADMVKVRASYKAGYPVPGTIEKIESELVLTQ